MSFRIGKHQIGSGHPCFIIAEAGVNHNGDIDLAKKLVDVAQDAGVDAVKFQTFSAAELVTPAAPKAEYQRVTTKNTSSQYEMLKALELSREAHIVLKQYCQSKGLLFLSTPFDEKGLALLQDLDVIAYKISSTDTTNLPFIEDIAKTGRPVILSTGMSYLEEIGEAVSILREHLKDQWALLQCTSNYPTEPANVHLRAMQTLCETFKATVGFSDHTRGVGAAPYAVAMGASIIEKHFTLDKSLPGPDHPASLDPQELKGLVSTIRQVELMMGSAEKRPTSSEMNIRKVMQKSVVAGDFIPEGTILERRHLVCKRPSTGLMPRELKNLLGKKTTRAIQKDELIDMSLLQLSKGLHS